MIKRLPARAQRPLALLVLAIAIILTYANAISGPFVYDDQASVVANTAVRQIWPPSIELWTARDTPLAGRPLVGLSFAANYALGGLDVRGYHAVNILLHVFCAWLLFGIVRRTLELDSVPASLRRRSIPLALAASLLWALHPLNSEVVDYLTQRTESMMALCYLLALYGSVRAASSAHPRRWYALAVTSCALGMACKESMVTAPLLIILYDSTFLFGSMTQAWRRRRTFYTALSATWLFLGVLLSFAPRGASAGWSTSTGSKTYLLNQAVMIVRYLRLVVSPRALVLNYGYPRPLSLTDVLPEALLVVALFGAVIWLWRAQPKAGLLGAWFFLTLAPTSSIVPIVTEVGAERRMYLPMAALAVAFVLAGNWLLRRIAVLSRAIVASRRPARLMPACAIAIVSILTVSLAAESVQRNREYGSAFTLATTTLERWPTGRAHHMVAVELMAAGRHAEALTHLRRAVVDDPKARYTLGVELLAESKFPEAIEALKACADEESEDGGSTAEMLGRAYLAEGAVGEATSQFRRALDVTPTRAEIHNWLAYTFFVQHQYAAAASEYPLYLTQRSDDADALTNYAIALAAIGQPERATAAFQQAVNAEPANANRRINLARSLLSARRFDEAAQQASEALTQSEGRVAAAAQDVLGVALASKGMTDEAVAHFQAAVRLDPTDRRIREDLTAALRIAR